MTQAEALQAEYQRCKELAKSFQILANVYAKDVEERKDDRYRLYRKNEKILTELKELEAAFWACMSLTADNDVLIRDSPKKK